ncbi:MAG: hypothetical protein KAX19_00665, partial [Candidatus Brocadiae bacterium]|nr:hypothetical protein [Candidatus Brocadiia bacterium]
RAAAMKRAAHRQEGTDEASTEAGRLRGRPLRTVGASVERIASPSLLSTAIAWGVAARMLRVGMSAALAQRLRY